MTIATGSGFGGKPRPALVVQADPFLQIGTIIVAPFTTAEGKLEVTRPRFEPTAENGLVAASDLMIDILITVRHQQVGRVLGRLTGEEIAVADRALLVFLGLGA